jgi:hypothetical protein
MSVARWRLQALHLGGLLGAYCRVTYLLYRRGPARHALAHTPEAVSCAKPMDNGVRVERGDAHLKAFVQDALRATGSFSLPIEHLLTWPYQPPSTPRAAPASPGGGLTLGG